MTQTLSFLAELWVVSKQRRTVQTDSKWTVRHNLIWYIEVIFSFSVTIPFYSTTIPFHNTPFHSATIPFHSTAIPFHSTISHSIPQVGACGLQFVHSRDRVCGARFAQWGHVGNSGCSKVGGKGECVLGQYVYNSDLPSSFSPPLLPSSNRPASCVMMKGLVKQECVSGVMLVCARASSTSHGVCVCDVWCVCDVCVCVMCPCACVPSTIVSVSSFSRQCPAARLTLRGGRWRQRCKWPLTSTSSLVPCLCLQYESLTPLLSLSMKAWDRRAWERG